MEKDNPLFANKTKATHFLAANVCSMPHTSNTKFRTDKKFGQHCLDKKI